MGDAARKLNQPSTADERMAALLALPLRAEPETDEERAIFEEAEVDVRAGRRGYSTGEVLETIEKMRRDQGE